MVGKLSANWWRPITMQCEEVENEGSLFQLRWSFEPCRTHLWSICAFLNGLSFLGWPPASWFNSLAVCTVNIYIILYWILLDMKYMNLEFMSVQGMISMDMKVLDIQYCWWISTYEHLYNSILDINLLDYFMVSWKLMYINPLTVT